MKMSMKMLDNTMKCRPNDNIRPKSINFTLIIIYYLQLPDNI